ncbi:MAG: hypothetical protein HY738_16180, partial [Bacteroidia bacterium]|nr:hypothetical protein [Bacteroidia bacterium]
MMSDMRSSDYGYNEKNYTQTKTITPINVIIYFIKKWFFHEEWNDFTDYSPKYEGFRSAVMTKVISKYGLLDEITVVNQGMTNTTKMEAYDAETGEVLLTSTKNEFDEPVYSFTYPAHLAYMGMEGAFFNIGSIFKVNSTSYSSEGLLTISNPMKYFTPGDILWAEEKDEDGETLQSYPLWVCRF